MGRPKADEETKVVSIRLPLSVYQRWERTAAKKGVPIATLLRSKLTDAAR